MKLLRSLLAASFLVAAALPTEAQISPNGPVLTQPAQLRSYRASVLGLAPASSLTDLITLSGKSSGPVRLRKIHCSGVTTAAATALLQVIKRSTLDTGGTSAAMTAVPLNPTQPAAGAAAKSYTANPTTGTAVGTLDAGYLTTNTLASSAVNNGGITFDFSDQNVWLTSATQQVALNGNGASFSAGAALACSVEWSE